MDYPQHTALLSLFFISIFSPHSSMTEHGRLFFFSVLNCFLFGSVFLSDLLYYHYLQHHPQPPIWSLPVSNRLKTQDDYREGERTTPFLKTVLSGDATLLTLIGEKKSHTNHSLQRLKVCPSCLCTRTIFFFPALASPTL